MREDLPPIEALREHVVALAAVYAGHEGRLMAQLLAESQYDPATLEEFKAQFWRPRREVVNRMIERAIEAGSIRGDRSADEIAERIYAPIYFKLLFGEGSFDPDTMRAGFDLALEGIGAEIASAVRTVLEHDCVIAVTDDPVLRVPLHGTR